MSFNQAYISDEKHQRWFIHMLMTKRPFFIAYYQNLPCAYVRFNSDVGESIISIAIDFNFRNKKIASEIITLACLKVLTTTRITKIIAHIKIKNINSIKVFTRAFFVQKKTFLDTQTLTLEYPAYDEFLC